MLSHALTAATGGKGGGDEVCGVPRTAGEVLLLAGTANANMLKVLGCFRGTVYRPIGCRVAAPVVALRVPRVAIVCRLEPSTMVQTSEHQCAPVRNRNHGWPGRGGSFGLAVDLAGASLLNGGSTRSAGGTDARTPTCVPGSRRSSGGPGPSDGRKSGTTCGLLSAFFRLNNVDLRFQI